MESERKKETRKAKETEQQNRILIRLSLFLFRETNLINELKGSSYRANNNNIKIIN